MPNSSNGGCCLISPRPVRDDRTSQKPVEASNTPPDIRTALIGISEESPRLLARKAAAQPSLQAQSRPAGSSGTFSDSQTSEVGTPVDLDLGQGGDGVAADPKQLVGAEVVESVSESARRCQMINRGIDRPPRGPWSCIVGRRSVGSGRRGRYRSARSSHYLAQEPGEISVAVSGRATASGLPGVRVDAGSGPARPHRPPGQHGAIRGATGVN